MRIEHFDFVNVVERAKALNCNVPTGIALLPRNFENSESKQALLHESTVSTVRVLFRANNIIETSLEREGEKFFEISEKSFEEWIGPIIFLGYSFYSQNPHIISLALNIIANYLTDFFKGIPAKQYAKLNIVIETKKKTYKRIYFEGPVSGLQQLTEIIQKVSSDE